jgi:hypothetical protein
MRREKLFERLEKAYSPIEQGQEVEIGLLRPEDGLGLSLVYYSIYGRDFPLDLVYDPEELVRRNQGDEQYTAVARTPRGEIVGCIGMFRGGANPDVFEFGQLNVLEGYRRSHLAVELSRYMLHKVAIDVGVPVLYVEGVCNHAVSQRLAVQEGFTPTGLEVECMPAGAYQAQGAPVANVSLLLMFLLKSSRGGLCHLPSRYHKVVAEICTALGMDCQLSEEGRMTGTTESSVFTIDEGNLVRLSAPHAGEDFLEVMEQTTSLASGRGVMQVYLNLGDAGAVEAATLLREQGFFYGGFLPGWFGDSGLVLQKTWNTPDWEAIKLYGKRAKALRDYIRADCETVMNAGG